MLLQKNQPHSKKPIVSTAVFDIFSGHPYYHSYSQYHTAAGSASGVLDHSKLPWASFLYAYNRPSQYLHKTDLYMPDRDLTIVFILTYRSRNGIIKRGDRSGIRTHAPKRNMKPNISMRIAKKNISRRFMNPVTVFRRIKFLEIFFGNLIKNFFC